MIREHDLIVLTCDVPEAALKEGDVGTVVDLHGEAGYEVEFSTVGGDTVAVVSLMAAQVRPVGPRDMYHSRSVERGA